MVNILLGIGSRVFVVTTEVLQCYGPNDGVEHCELGTAVVRALGEMGVHVSKVIAFASDPAPVLHKAFNAVLKPLCHSVQWVSSFSHGLNNVAKEVMKSLDVELVALFEIALDVLHAKRYASLDPLHTPPPCFPVPS